MLVKNSIAIRIAEDYPSRVISSQRLLLELTEQDSSLMRIRILRNDRESMLLRPISNDAVIGFPETDGRSVR